MAVKGSIRGNRKAFMISFLALFVAVLIFSYVAFDLSKSDFSEEINYKELRITFVNDELSYLKDVYLDDSLTYSLQKSVYKLIEYLDDRGFDELNMDYRRLNELIYESMMNGTFDGSDGGFGNNYFGFIIEKIDTELYGLF